MPSNRQIPHTPFSAAIAEANLNAAIRVAKEDAGVCDLKLPVGSGYERALHAAVRLKSVELTEVLLHHGMEADVLDSRGYTPLFLAPELYSPLGVVERLVGAGADVHVKDDGPLWSAIWQASYGYGNMVPVIQFLAEQGSTPRGLCHSAEAGNLRIARLVLSLGADVNETDENGHTPLDYCTGITHTWQFQSPQRHPAVADYLNEHGALPGSQLSPG